MKKKSIVLLAVAAASVIGVTGLTFSFGAPSMGLIAGTNEPKIHTISFTAGDVTPGIHDDDYSLTPFTLHKDDAIEDADGTTYDIKSVPFDDEYFTGTFIAHFGSVTFGGDYIITIDSAEGEEVDVQFALVKRAELDLSASFISYYVDVADDDHYHNSDHFRVSTDTDPVYTIYGAFMNTYSYYGHKIMVDEVKLVFTCPR